MSENIASKIWTSVSSHGGIEVPYSKIYDDLNAVEDYDKKKIREVIRSYCSEKETYKRGNEDLYLIEKDPLNKKSRHVTIKN